MTRSKSSSPARLTLVLGLVLASTMMLGANCRDRDTHPPVEIELEAAVPVAVDADMQDVIADVYGGGERLRHTVEKGDVEVVWQLEYELSRTHESADAASLSAALRSQGYTIDEDTPTTSPGLFVRKSSIAADILVSASEGSKSFNVSITEM